jgi:tRNA (adenine57-N1/adenine58-N1)-methyltransferase
MIAESSAFPAARIDFKGHVFYFAHRFHGVFMTANGPLRDGETVVFIDRKEREYLRRLAGGKEIKIRDGKVAADEIIGRDEGTLVRSSLSDTFLVFRPTLAQLIPNLPRQAQVIYPKDIGSILVWADIQPGLTVVESGVGAGALTVALLRALGPTGKLVSIELREDFARMAKENVARYYGAAEHWSLKLGDVAEALDETEIDRVILDLPEPWKVTERAWGALKPGGILLSYLPTVIQVKTLVDSLREHHGFAAIECFETLFRYWHIKEMSMRPQHRMVAHTGFITVARRLAGK